MLRALPLVTVLTGCTFYIGGGSSPEDAGGGSEGNVQPDAQITDADDDAPSDAPLDSPVPVDAPIDSVVVFDVLPLPDANPILPIETLLVPCTGEVVTTQLTYSSALNYRVRASGQCKVDEIFGNGVAADSEYYGTVVPRDREDGIDIGLGLYDTTLGFDKSPSWGSYRSNHVYEITGPGFDIPVTARFHDKANNAYGNNSGTLTVEFFLQ